MILASLAICRAEPSEGETVSIIKANESAPRVYHSNWRSGLLSQFPYKPAETVFAADLPKSIPQAPPDLDIVVLEPFEVREKGIKFRELERIFRSQDEEVRSEALSRRFGIGSRAYMFGSRYFALGYVSVFYIPVSAGFRFSW